MDSAYIRALEMRARWLRWGKEELSGAHQRLKNQVASSYWKTGIPAYIDTLESGDTFYMNDRFCDLVEHARDTVPDTLAFDSSWMQSPQGWLWIEKPFEVPLSEQDGQDFKAAKLEVPNWAHRIAAVGWRHIPEGQVTAKGMVGDASGRVASKGSYQFLCFTNIKLKENGFGCWSYFMLCDGDILIKRIREFESMSIDVGGQYVSGKDTDIKHEMRWIYSAFYLMAQRLATTVQHQTDRHTRRRNEIAKMKVTPFIKVITLRRMEEARKKDPSGNAPDWQFQWTVVGHWRNQFYPSDNTHRPVFVEAYVKGPEGKPLKPTGVKLFVAGR